MDHLAYQRAYERISAEFSEMPGMRLTPQQIHRLSGFDAALCQRVLEALVEAKFLRTGLDGRYGRVTDGAPAQRHAAKAALRHLSSKSPARRAS